MTDAIDAMRLFEAPEQARFPICTQVTLNHGICDSRCVACPVGRLNFGDASETTRREFAPGTRRHMTFEIFAKVADEVAHFPHAWLRLHARGEPLLHPQFVEFIRYAKSSGVRLVQAFTDAIALTHDMSLAILDAGLDVLECSIHGHTETYELLMRNGRFEQVCENVLRFKRLRDASGMSTKLVVSAVDQLAFQPDKASHYAFWSAAADQVIYRPHHSWGNRVEAPCGAAPHSRMPCPQLWTRCTVGPTGSLLACFNSWSETLEEVLGDLSQPGTNIAGVWQSERFMAIRQSHANGSYLLPCCKHCEDWRGSSWGQNSYEHLLGVKLGVTGNRRAGEVDGSV